MIVKPLVKTNREIPYDYYDHNKTYDLALLKSLISFYEQINKIIKHDMVICL